MTIKKTVNGKRTTVYRLLPSTSMRRAAALGLSATLIATASIPVLPTILPPQEVQAAWYNEDWRYRAPVDITSPTTQSNVYMSLTLDTSDTDKFNPDCSDLRFVTRSGQLIPHHIASGCGTGSTQIQILFGELPAGASQIYLYYGNSQASNTSIPDPFNNIADGTTGIIQAEESSQGPVAHWKFDEGYGTTAHSSSSWSGAIGSPGGTLHNGPTWQTEDMCVSGKCLYFDGVDDVVGVVDTENVSGSITLSAWIKINGFSANYRSGIISRRDTDTGLNFNITGSLESPEGRLVVYEAGDSTNRLQGDTVLEKNRWHLVSVAIDGANARLYINGKLDGSGSLSWSWPEENEIKIGSTKHSSNAYFFNGFIDEPKIYNYARTQSQIQQDYVAGITSLQQQGGNLSNGLVGYWKMDEQGWDGTPGEVGDSSGNGNGMTSRGTANGAGRYGSGSQFDGMDTYLELESAPEYLRTAIRTKSYWINPNSYTDSPTIYSTQLSHAGDGSDPDSSLHLRTTVQLNEAGQVWLRYYGYSCTGPDGHLVRNLTSADPAPLNEWSFVTEVVDYSTSNMSLYINGQPQGSLSAPNYSCPNHENNWWIGRHKGASGVDFTGRVDEFRTYNRALSTAEIQQIYNYAPKPVGYWDFEDGDSSTVYDKSGNGNDGAWSGSGEWHGEGKVGKSGSFNGVDDGVSISYSRLLDYDIDESFTFASWIKLGENRTSTSSIVNTSKGSSSYSLAMNVNTSNRLKSCMYNVATEVSNCTEHVDLSQFIGKWVHVAYVKTPTRHCSLVNGLERECVDITLEETTLGESEELWIGRHRSGNSYFDGQIDEVKIYNYARTQQQIIEDMQAEQPAVNSPIGHWKFDEGQGDIARNSGVVGEVLDASLINMANPSTASSGWSKHGIEKGGISFDAEDDRVEIAATALFPSNQTYSAWVKTTSVQGTIIAHGSLGEGSANSGVYMRTSGGKAQFNAADGLGFRVVVNGQTIINDDQWHHVVGIKGANYVYLYVDGKLEGKQSIVGFTPSGGRILIGSRGPMPTGYVLNGMLDEVRAYNFALTPQDILVDYNQSSAMVAGNTSTEPTTSESSQPASTPSNSAGSEYCVPGSDDYCAPPVGEWKFEEGSGTTVIDSSDNDNNGTLFNSPAWMSGKHGKALSFDANGLVQTVRISGGGSLQDVTEDSYTLQGWFNPVSTPPGGSNKSATIIGRPGNHTLIGYFEDQRIRVSIYTTEGNFAAYSESTYPLNRWHHVTATVDEAQKKLKLYIDGKFEGGLDYTGDLFDYGTNQYTIGSSKTYGNCTDDFAYCMDGKIDDVRIYNYARTPAQVAWDYNKGKPIAHYKFNECQGDTIHDASGNGLHGVLNLGIGGETSIGTCDSFGAWSLGKTGKYNGGMNFDGVDDYVSPGSTTLFAYQNITYSLWINPKHTANTSVGILSSGERNDIRFDSSGNLTSMIYDGVQNIISTNVSMDDLADRWSHITVVVESGEVRIFVNGKLSNTFSGLGTILYAGGDRKFAIGSSASSGGNIHSHFSGLIDDVQIFNYALTEEQVKVLHNGGAVRWE